MVDVNYEYHAIRVLNVKRYRTAHRKSYTYVRAMGYAK